MFKNILDKIRRFGVKKIIIISVSVIACVAIICGMFMVGGCMQDSENSENPSDTTNGANNGEEGTNINSDETSPANKVSDGSTSSENSESSKNNSNAGTTKSTTTKKANEVTTNKSTTTTTATTKKPSTTTITKKPTTTTTQKPTTTTTADPYKTIILHQKTTYYGFEGYFTLDRYENNLKDYGIITNGKATYPTEYYDIETDKIIWFICDGNVV